MNSELASYIESVLSGTLNVGSLERCAVQRFEWELANPPAPWVYREELAQQAIEWFPGLLRHSKGRWGQSDEGDAQPFHLSDWQQFIVSQLFGWRHETTQLRRFRRLYLTIARKNGKTTFSAGLALLIMYAEFPRDPKAEIYATGANKAQAALLFDEAVRMIRSSPDLLIEADITKSGMFNTNNDATMRPLGTSPQHGSNPSMVIRDELHEWTEEHRALNDAILTGSGARRQPLFITITTAGDPGGHSPIWEDEDDYARKVAQSVGEDFDTRYLSFMCRPDQDDDPYDPQNFRKANPNLGVSILAEDLQEMADEAQRRPLARLPFCRFFMNSPVGSDEKAIDKAQWQAAAITEPDLLGCECWAGLDMGSVWDFASLSLLFPLDDTEGTYFLKSWTWASAKSDAGTDREPFLTWAEKGQIRIHPGDAIDFSTVAAEVVAILDDYSCLGLAFDVREARMVVQSIQEATNIEPEEFTQGYASYNEPCKEFTFRAAQGHINHDGNELLAWQADNLIFKRDSRGYVMPDKSHPTRKIDSMAAAIMAFSLALFTEQEDPLGHYRENAVEAW